VRVPGHPEDSEPFQPVQLTCPHCGYTLHLRSSLLQLLQPVYLCPCGEPSVVEVHLRVPTPTEHVAIETNPNVIKVSAEARRLANQPPT
jgi:hypothetical protein